MTDGTALFGVLGARPEETSLYMLEDCLTMDLVVVHEEDLLRPGVREVRPAGSV